VRPRKISETALLALDRPPAARGKPDWTSDGKDWPNRQFSRFIQAGGLTWHVQVAGSGPVLLLLHGTGAATHTWRDFLVPLSARYTVVAPDLPGHGFTDTPPETGMTMPGMANGVTALLKALDLAPDFAAGHSAGAAIMLMMCLSGQMSPRVVVSLNGALMPYGGPMSGVLAPIARTIARNPFVPFLFSFRASDPKVVSKLLSNTGSKIDEAGERYYARLARRTGHTGAALSMMGNWDLTGLAADLPRLQPRLVLIVGELDRAIPPADAERLAAICPSARIIRMPGLGHLSHEERPAETIALFDEVFA
jgi:magnesium chelatase accessory protein